MNPKKFCFISCVNDRFQYEEALRYIHALDVPEGYEIETVAIEGAASMCAGYNEGMRRSDATYKIYLHQDVLVVNKRFLHELLDRFSDPQLGLLGVAGAATLPANGVWWESSHRYGQVYDSHTGAMQLLAFEDVTEPYRPVMALDGLILITQYDVPWREDLFTGWHFYDLSHCMEFRRAGYEVGVPRQEQTWVMHDCGLVNTQNGFEQFRQIFLQTYGSDLKNALPLVSVLIPAYNRPEMLEEAIQSVLNQTYPNIEIVICDDSSHDGVERMIQPYLAQYPQIDYVRNDRNYHEENAHRCFERSKGEYISYLMDDDLFLPTKIERMMDLCLREPSVVLVSSPRAFIDEKGNRLPQMKGLAYEPISREDGIFDGIAVGNHALRNCANMIGEPTTVLFKRTALTTKFGLYRGIQYVGINDLATWISLLATGHLGWIAEPLSALRIHGGQNQGNPKYIVPSITQWYTLLRDARLDGFLADERDYKIGLANHLRNCSWMVQSGLQHDESLLTGAEIQALKDLADDLARPHAAGSERKETL